jgi:hypothetical protein
MIRQRTAEVGFKIKLGCHVFRATGITAYLEAGGSLENAQAMAAHESPRTTKLYDRTGDEITLDEVERSRFKPSPAESTGLSRFLVRTRGDDKAARALHREGIATRHPQGD